VQRIGARKRGNAGRSRTSVMRREATIKRLGSPGEASGRGFFLFFSFVASRELLEAKRLKI